MGGGAHVLVDFDAEDLCDALVVGDVHVAAAVDVARAQVLTEGAKERVAEGVGELAVDLVGQGLRGEQRNVVEAGGRGGV